eukprot:13528664-Alexandrium_andersonii.AAC.1
MDEAEKPSSMLLRLAKPSLVPNSTEEGHMAKLAAMCVFYLRLRMLSFVQACCGTPIAMTYQSDCTPDATQETITVAAGGAKVSRAGGRTSEYLLHRLFARTIDHKQCCLFGAPQRLADKTAMTH